MTRVRTGPLFSACLMAAVLCSGCSQKKPAVAVPQTPAASAPSPSGQTPPAQPHAQSQEAQGAPGQGTPPPEPQPETQTVPPQAAPPAVEKTDSTKVKTARPRVNGKRSGAESARGSARTTVKDEAEPTPAAGPISPGLSGAEVAHNQTTTDQLLQSTEATLSGIKRRLSQEEQAIVAQIHDYINQSRQAIKINDLTRAYNLALKARLLSDDLAKR